MLTYQLSEGNEMETIASACRALLRFKKDDLTGAVIDAISDLAQLPEGVEEAREELLRRSEVERRRTASKVPLLRNLQIGDVAMGIHVSLKDPEAFEPFSTFGPYSINAEAFAIGVSGPFLVMHDSGSIVAVTMSKNDFDLFRQVDPQTASLLVPVT